jgi:hypothetical protein
VKKEFFYRGAMLGLGFLLSSGVTFASSGHLVKSLFGEAQVNVNNQTTNVNDLTYNGVQYYPLVNISKTLSKAGIIVHQNASELQLTSPYQSTVTSIDVHGKKLGSSPQLIYDGKKYLDASSLVHVLNNAGNITTFNGNSFDMALNVQPIITSVKMVNSSSIPEFVISGKNFGTFPTPYTGNSNDLIVHDLTTDWYMGQGQNVVETNITKWTPKEIIVWPTAQSYGPGGWQYNVGDKVNIAIINPQDNAQTSFTFTFN